MPVGYYIIPMTDPPYSRANPQRPRYVDEIRCNWTGHNVDSLGVYICKVNTTDAKHTDLASRQGVFRLPAGYDWNTLISSLPAQAKSAIGNWCTSRGIAYDDTETIGELLMRIINSGLWSIGNAPANTQYQDLTEAQKEKIINLCERWNISPPQPTDTLKSISARCGRVWWYAPGLTIPEG